MASNGVGSASIASAAAGAAATLGGSAASLFQFGQFVSVTSELMVNVEGGERYTSIGDSLEGINFHSPPPW